MRNWFTSIARRVLERRSSLENPQTPLSFPAEWLLDIFQGGRTDSGIRVSEMSALQVSTIFSCVNIVSDGVATLPWRVYEAIDMEGVHDAKKIARDHYIYDLIANQPNPEMTTSALLKVAMVHALLWGNAFIEIERDASARPIALWPRSPHKTRAVRTLNPVTIEGDVLKPGTLLYETNDCFRGGDTIEDQDSYVSLAKRRFVLAEDMIHIPGLSLDGRVGQSTTWTARQMIGLALASEKYAAKFFGNGARPAGILTMPGQLDDDKIENMRRSWAEAHGGENVHKVAVLEEGIKFEKIAATPEEGQLLDTRSFVRTEIAALFGVPLYLLGVTEKSGRSNVEQCALSFLSFGLNPWIQKIEQNFTVKLFPKKATMPRPPFFVKADTRKLSYPDAESKAKFYAAGRQWGFLNADDIRAMEDMNPIADGSGQPYWMPVIQQNALAAVKNPDGNTAQMQQQERALRSRALEHSGAVRMLRAASVVTNECKTPQELGTQLVAAEQKGLILSRTENENGQTCYRYVNAAGKEELRVLYKPLLLS